MRSAQLELKTGDGNFQVQAIDPISGNEKDLGTLTATEGKLQIEIDIPEGELGLRVTSPHHSPQSSIHQGPGYTPA